MADKIQMSLDDIIKETKQAKRAAGGAGNRNGNKGANPRRSGGNAAAAANNNGRNNTNNVRNGGVQKKRRSEGETPALPRGAKLVRRDVNKTWKHDMFEGGKKLLRAGASVGGGVSTGGAGGTTKLLVSNLDYGVSESDIHELFADFGPLKTASVHYDRSGRSLGTADVVFERRADAIKAMKQYNGVPLDGRPMNIQLAISELPVAPVAPVRARPAPQPQRQQQQTQQRRGGPANNNGRQGGNNGRQAGGGRPNGGGRKAAPKQMTAAELDAELDAYNNDMKV